MNRPARDGRWLKRAGVALVGALLLAAGFAPSQSVNLAHLYLLESLSADAELTQPGSEAGPVAVPSIFGTMPFAGLHANARLKGIWAGMRYARLLERRGLSSDQVGCAWDPSTCVVAENLTRPSPSAEQALVRGFVDGRIAIRSRLDAELLALACLRVAAMPDASTLARGCRDRLAFQWPDLVPALDGTALVVGEYADELTVTSARRLADALSGDEAACGAGRAFLRSWITARGFSTDQIDAAAALVSRCQAGDELALYYARAADLAGRPADARVAYEQAGPDRHGEVAFWHAEFLIRTDTCGAAAAAVDRFSREFRSPVSAAHLQATLAARCGMAAPSRSAACGDQSWIWRAAELPARAEDGVALSPETIVPDAGAPSGQTRRATRFGTVLAFGPYVRLPYGQYRATFVLRAAGASLTGRVARLDVREDTNGWRPLLRSRIVRGRQIDPRGYSRFEDTFTVTGEGIVSFAVVTLTGEPVWFDRIELRPEGCF